MRSAAVIGGLIKRREQSYLEPFKIMKWRLIALFAILSTCKFGTIKNKDFRFKLIANLYELGYKNLE
jgi:hypothetical protein